MACVLLHSIFIEYGGYEKELLPSYETKHLYDDVLAETWAGKRKKDALLFHITNDFRTD